MFFSAVGFMIGTGGSALVSKIMGEGDLKRARGIFSALVYIAIGTGIVLSLIGLVILEPVSILFGAKGETLEACLTYGYILIPSLTFFILQKCVPKLCSCSRATKARTYCNAINGHYKYCFRCPVYYRF